MFLFFLGLSRRMCSCDGLWLLVMRIHTHAKFHAQLHMNVHVHIHDETNNTTPDIRTKQKDPNERKQGRACSCARPWFVPAARAEGVDSAGGGYHMCIYIYTCIHTCKHTYLLTYVFTYLRTCLLACLLPSLLFGFVVLCFLACLQVSN